MLLCQFPQVKNDDVSDTKPNSGFPVILCQCAHGITDISGKFNLNQGVQQSGKFQTWEKSGNFVEGQGKNEYWEKSGRSHGICI